MRSKTKKLLEQGVLPFRTHFTALTEQTKPEVNNRPSLTVPNQSMSVKTILERYAMGLGTSGVKVPIYEGDESFMPDLNKMDLADRQALIEAAGEELEDIKKSLDEKAQKQADEKAAKKRKKSDFEDADVLDETDKPLKDKDLQKS